MKVEVVLTESDIAQEFAEAIEARDLPEKFFYWFPRSAVEWAALAADPELYGGLGETWKSLASEASALARSFPGRLPMISFGAGDGRRDCGLIGALKDTGCNCVYYPVDASQAMLEMACASADDQDVEAVGIKADISSPVHLVYAADAAEPPRLLVMAGNTMGSFDPLAEIRYLAQCMKPEDRLIVDGEIFDEQQSMTRRDNAPVRRFLSSLLASVGIQEEDGEILFNHKRDERHEGLHLITRYFRAERDLTATVGGQKIPLQRGERIGLNFAYLYTTEAFDWLLCEQGGLEVLNRYESPDGRFVTAVCRR
jgi:uncharacterized SAM-dependent methyltransferase